MTLKCIYDESYSFLLEESKQFVSKEQIDTFINTSDITRPIDVKQAYQLFLAIMQDFHSYPNVIDFNNRKPEIMKILHNCDLKYISELRPEDLLEDFRKEFAFDKDAMWLKYCKSIISGASFMLSFKGDNEFINTLNSFDKNVMTREALGLYLSKKIYNMGFPIACNWIKELGYYGYVKPDRHIKDVCQVLGLVYSDDDLECFETVIKIADEAGVKPYTVDKVWWLICTGNFYRYNIQLLNPEERKRKFLNLLIDMK